MGKELELSSCRSSVPSFFFLVCRIVSEVGLVCYSCGGLDV